MENVVIQHYNGQFVTQYNLPYMKIYTSYINIELQCTAYRNMYE
jgi:hypothetical protein